MTFLKRFQIFQVNQKYCTRTHINFPVEAKRTRIHQKFQESFLRIPQEHIRFSSILNITRTDQIFQEILPKISLEYIRFSRRKKSNKSRSNFPGDLSQNYVRTDTILQETIPQRTDILKNCLRRMLFVDSNTLVKTLIFMFIFFLHQ